MEKNYIYVLGKVLEGDAPYRVYEACFGSKERRLNALSRMWSQRSRWGFINDRKDNVEAAQKMKMQGIVFKDALQLRNLLF